MVGTRLFAKVRRPSRFPFDGLGVPLAAELTFDWADVASKTVATGELQMSGQGPPGDFSRAGFFRVEQVEFF